MYIRLNASIDFEGTTPIICVLLLEAVDNGLPTQLSSSSSLQIIIVNNNDNAPFFILFEDTSIPEDIDALDFVTLISASDPDLGDEITFSIQNSTSQSSFLIDGDNGIITTNRLVRVRSVMRMGVYLCLF